MILLVEDELELGRLIARELEASGYHVLHAVDGIAALRFFQQEAPNLVILDWMLPGMDGLEVLRRIRSDPRTALLPVVILTSSKEQQDIINGYRLGCNSYVRKPVDFDQFIEAARQLGLYWLLLNEPLPT